MRSVRPRRALRLGTAIAVVLGANLYVIRARDVAEELRAGDEAYSSVCDRITASAAAAGSPGTIAHLLAALQSELAALAEHHPRWYAAYEKDPAAYRCGTRDPP